MRNLFLLVLLLTGATAHAYESGQANPVFYGTHDQQFRTVVKSATAGFSDAIQIGDVLSYDVVNNQDGYTVTRVGANTVNDTNLIACISLVAIATGNTSEFRCVSQGYVGVTNWTPNSIAITQNMRLCTNASGQATPCAPCDSKAGANDCKFGTATGNSVITAVQAKGAGGGGGSNTTGLNVYINSR